LGFNQNKKGTDRQQNFLLASYKEILSTSLDILQGDSKNKQGEDNCNKFSF